MSVISKKTSLGILFFLFPVLMSSARGNVFQQIRDVAFDKDSDVVVLPQYLGGEDALQKYLVLTVVLTEEDSPKWLVDRLLYSFTVTSKGNIEDVKLKTPVSKLKGHVSKDIVDRAFWLVKKMPEWIPGTRNGIPEDMKYIVSVKLNVIYQKKQR